MTSVVVVALAGRGSLPFATLHGEPLFLHAVGAATTLGRPAVLVDPEQREPVARSLRRADLDAEPLEVSGWADRVAGQGVFLHDPLCPLTPPGFLREVWDRSVLAPGRALAAYRPVTDTVKIVDGDRISGTIDRERLVIVTSPLVLPPGLTPSDAAAVADLAALVTGLRRRVVVELVRAPSLARRVGDEAAVQVLECVDEVAHRVHADDAVSGARPAPRGLR